MQWLWQRDVHIGFDSSDGTTPGTPPAHIYNWTAGYTQGATSITISSGSLIVANQTMLVLDQCDTGFTGTPCAGTAIDNSGFYVCGERHRGSQWLQYGWAGYRIRKAASLSDGSRHRNGVFTGMRQFWIDGGHD